MSSRRCQGRRRYGRRQGGWRNGFTTRIRRVRKPFPDGGSYRNNAMLNYIIAVILCKTAAVTRADFTELNKTGVSDFSLNGKIQSKNATDSMDCKDFSRVHQSVSSKLLHLCNPWRLFAFLQSAILSSKGKRDAAPFILK